MDVDETMWVARLLWLEAGMPSGGPARFYREASAFLERRASLPPLPESGPLVERFPERQPESRYPASRRSRGRGKDKCGVTFPVVHLPSQGGRRKRVPTLAR